MSAPTITAFLKMVEDFGSMGTGEFIRHYPDCGSFEGYGYIQRKAKVLRAHLSGKRPA